MKATIKMNGILVITAESEIESYALDKWMHENWGNSNNLLKKDLNKMFEIELNYNCEYINNQRIHPANFLKP